jgi:hypothetical protein
LLDFRGWSGEQEEIDLQWMIDNDMSCWYYWALYINPINVINKHQWVSEFEKNYEKYGYKFTDDNFVNWTNGDLVHTKLMKIAKDNNNRSYKYRKIAGFQLGEFSTTLRCNMKDLLELREKDFKDELLLDKTKQFIENYVAKNLE